MQIDAFTYERLSSNSSSFTFDKKRHHYEPVHISTRYPPADTRDFVEFYKRARNPSKTPHSPARGGLEICMQSVEMT